MLREVLDNLGELDGGDHELLREPPTERFCRGLQQQGQSPQTALLWDYKSDAPVSTTRSRSRRVSPLRAMKHKIWGVPREFLKSRKRSGLWTKTELFT